MGTSVDLDRLDSIRYAEAKSASTSTDSGSISRPVDTTHVEEPATVTVGGTYSGSIGEAGEVDNITLELTAGQTVLISLTGDGETPLPDTFMTLGNPDHIEIAHDDDGGLLYNSLITITATETGTYTITAGAYPESGLTGGYHIAVVEQTTDTVPDDLTSEVAATVGATTYGFMESAEDVDVYQVTLTAGSLYTFDVAGGADYETFFLDVPPGELDTLLTIYDAEGNEVAFNDDVSFPDDISSAAAFIAETSGTYYIEIATYGNTGGYTLDVSEVNFSEMDPLDAIDWGTQLESGNVLVYFAGEGEEFDGVTSMGWQEFEICAALDALQSWANFSNLTFTVTDSAEAATFHLVTTESDEFLGYFNPPGETNAGVGVFAVNGTGWDNEGGLAPGGYGFITLVHEFGHGLGLAHPHDNGGTSEIMPGVTGPFGSYGVFDLNQGIYTTMSYNDGWQLHPDAESGFPAGFPTTYGYQSGPGAFDIALIQEKYGADTDFNCGDNVYCLPTSNQAGTFYSTIWDTGGNDTIVNNGSASSIIDLTAATLDYSATGGGVLSWVDGIFGGFTIANGVVIENATGGGGDDLLIGNTACNTLTGRGGNDTLMGGDGDDTLDGGSGADTMTGGDGDDTYKVNKPSDAVTEAGDEGCDTVESSITYTLGANVEKLTLTGGATINGTGNGLANTLIGNGAANTLNGGGGDDSICGGGGNDTLNGGGGSDTLDGGEGRDVLKGGAGNDTLVVDSTSDTVTESSGQGNDTVEASVTYKLGANVENLVLTGCDAINGTGNGAANHLTGNSAANTLNGAGGSDWLNGGGGNDTLNGGAGADHFVFDGVGGPGNIDRIIGFAHNTDEIVLDQSAFAALGLGALGASNFVASSAGVAVDGDDHILYDTDNGKLYYDADGAGGEAAIQIAQLTGAPTITADDFVVS